jgi:hypothetical protein
VIKSVREDLARVCRQREKLTLVTGPLLHTSSFPDFGKLPINRRIGKLWQITLKTLSYLEGADEERAS